MVLISAHIQDPVQKLRLFRKWDTEMDIHTADETSYAAPYQEAFLKYVENQYCVKHRYVLFNKLETVPSSNLVPSAMASGPY
jgi:hypothetical protein